MIPARRTASLSKYGKVVAIVPSHALPSAQARQDQDKEEYQPSVANGKVNEFFDHHSLLKLVAVAGVAA